MKSAGEECERDPCEEGGGADNGEGGDERKRSRHRGREWCTG